MFKNHGVHSRMREKTDRGRSVELALDGGDCHVSEDINRFSLHRLMTKAKTLSTADNSSRTESVVSNTNGTRYSITKLVDRIMELWNLKTQKYVEIYVEILTFRGPCIVTYSYNESQRDALFLKFI